MFPQQRAPPQQQPHVPPGTTYYNNNHIHTTHNINNNNNNPVGSVLDYYPRGRIADRSVTNVSVPHHVLLPVVVDDSDATTKATPTTSTSHSSSSTTGSTYGNHTGQQQQQQQQQILSPPRKKCRQTSLVLDRRLQNDYLATRFRTYREVAMFQKREQYQQQQQQYQYQQQHQQHVVATNGPIKKNTDIKSVSAETTLNTNPTCIASAMFVDVEVDDPFWHGATPLEKMLVACCISRKNSTSDNNTSSSSLLKGGGHTRSYGGVDTTNTNDETQIQPPGVLARDQMVHFVGIMAMYCHDVPSRALALALLEVTTEMDENDDEDQQHRRQQYDENDNNNNDDDEVVRYSPTDQIETSDKGMMGENDDVNDEGSVIDKMESSYSERVVPVVVVERMSPKHVRPRNEQLPSRISIFMKAGGLKILSRWLHECVTPDISSVAQTPASTTTTKDTKKQPKKQPQSTSVKPNSVRTQASSTGKLLLPLLQFLQRIPIDRTTRKLMKQAKLGDEVTQIQATMKEILDSWEVPSEDVIVSVSEQKTHPKSGGLAVTVVSTEVNMLLEIWKTKWKEIKKIHLNEKEINSNSLESPAPFEHLLSQIEDRLNVLRKYDGVDSRISTTDDSSGIAAGSSSTNETTTTSNEQSDWLNHVIKKREAKSAKILENQKIANVANERKLSVQERERLERQKERKHFFDAQTADLKKKKEEMNEMLKRRRVQDAADAKEQQRKQQQQQSTRNVVLTIGLKRKKVTWKDGLTGRSSNVRKNLIEQVFVFTRDADVLLTTYDIDNDDTNQPKQVDEDTEVDDEDEDDDDDDEVVVIENY